LLSSLQTSDIAQIFLRQKTIPPSLFFSNNQKLPNHNLDFFLTIPSWAKALDEKPGTDIIIACDTRSADTKVPSSINAGLHMLFVTLLITKQDGDDDKTWSSWEGFSVTATATAKEKAAAAANGEDLTISQNV
jgi:hypothetical protein